MNTVIQKAAKGNRSALTQLYDANKAAVYYMSWALVRNAGDAADAAEWAMGSSLQAVTRGKILTEEEFQSFVMTQTARYCKKQVILKDKNSFKLPPKKDFEIIVNKKNIDINAYKINNYIYCLPAIQRFVLILRLIGKLSIDKISEIIGLSEEIVRLVIQAENCNLGTIYCAVKSVTPHCTLPVKEKIAEEFSSTIENLTLPEDTETRITQYIEFISMPTEVNGKKKNKKISIIISAVLGCLIIILGVLFITGSSQSEKKIHGAATGDASAGIEQPTDISEDGVVDSADNDNTEHEDTEAESDQLSTLPLDESLTYYADIVIEGYGTVTVQLNQNTAPVTVENFISLAENGFYDGLTFHRIIGGMMMQGGDPEGNGTGGSENTIVGEFAENGYDNPLSHTRGAISMARSNDYDSASSQFFIVQEDYTGWDGQYAVFGYVTEGIEIVDAVCNAAEPTDSNGSIAADAQPIISSVTIRTASAT